MAQLQNGKQYGVRNKQGIVLEANYESILLNDTLNFIVKINGKWGVINAKGKYTIKPRYDFIEPISENAVWCYKKGKKTKGNNSDTAAIYGSSNIENHETELLDKTTGKKTIKQKIESFETYDYKNFYVKIKGKIGVINNKGQLIIKAKYDDYTINHRDNFIVLFKGKKAVCFKMDSIKQVPLKDVFYFDHKVARINKSYSGFNEGLIDSTGSIVLSQNYHIAEYTDFYVYDDINRRYGIINFEGKSMAKLGQFKEIGKEIYTNMAFVKGYNDKVGIINRNGKLVIDTQFFAVSNYMFSDRYAWVIPDSLADTASIRKNGIDWCKQKYGVVDSGRHYILPPVYDFPAYFENGQAILSKGNEYGVIKMNGEMVLPFEYDIILAQPYGLYIISQNGKTGIANRQGEIILKPEYDEILDFKNGYAKIKMGENYGLIDTTGKVIIEPAPYGINTSEIELEKLNYPEFTDESEYN